jgi:hypothetical protein
MDILFAGTDEVSKEFQKHFAEKLSVYMTFTAAGMIPVPSRSQIRKDLQQCWPNLWHQCIIQDHCAIV